jgi:hypothetical protein
MLVRHARLLAAVAVLLLALPAAVLAADQSATIRFGRDDLGSAFSPTSGHDQSSNARDSLFPRTVVIARGGSVTFAIDRFHQPAIYKAGTDDEDIQPAPVRLALGPFTAAAPMEWTSPPGTFAEPGKYLVICNVKPHFVDFDMYGWVIVQ